MSVPSISTGGLKDAGLRLLDGGRAHYFICYKGN